MSKTITVTLSDAEYKALTVVALDPSEYVNNFAKERCRIAIDEIVNAEVQRKLAAGEPITGSKEDIVLAADVETAAQVKARQEQTASSMQTTV